MAASKQRAEKFLMQELKALSTGDRDDGFSAGLNGDDLFNWSVCIMGPEGSLYEGGIFQASLQFPHSYPDNPPVMRFITPIFHPNIWPDGKVCISILHPPGEDPLNPQEQASERWLPIHNVFSICMSVSISFSPVSQSLCLNDCVQVLSMLTDPNIDSPANIDAAVSPRARCC